VRNTAASQPLIIAPVRTSASSVWRPSIRLHSSASEACSSSIRLRPFLDQLPRDLDLPFGVICPIALVFDVFAQHLDGL